MKVHQEGKSGNTRLELEGELAEQPSSCKITATLGFSVSYVLPGMWAGSHNPDAEACPNEPDRQAGRLGVPVSPDDGEAQLVRITNAPDAHPFELMYTPLIAIVAIHARCTRPQKV